MKRRDWIIKSSQKCIFGKKKYKYYFWRKNLFLRKLFLRKVRVLTKKDFTFNYTFYRNILNTFNNRKLKYLDNVFNKNFLEKKPFFPDFAVKKNVFNLKSKGKNLINKNNLIFFFLPNYIIKNNYGLSYYILINKNNKYPLLIKELLDEENFGILQEKFFLNNLVVFDFNYYLNFNISLNCALEIYKILITLHFNKLI